MVMTPYPFTVRLREADRAALLAHFHALDREDRRLRFGATLGDDAIEHYVGRIDFEHHGVFGVHDNGLGLVAAVHIPVVSGSAELGLSVLPASRGHGLGEALMRRAITWLRNRGISAVRVVCLAENAAMMHLARKIGMRFLRAGPETDGMLELDRATPESRLEEWVDDQRGGTMRAFRANALRMQAFFSGAAPRA